MTPELRERVIRLLETLQDPSRHFGTDDLPCAYCLTHGGHYETCELAAVLRELRTKQQIERELEEHRQKAHEDQERRKLGR